MSIYGSVIPGGVRLGRLPVDLSAAARRRLKWFVYYGRVGTSGDLPALRYQSADLLPVAASVPAPVPDESRKPVVSASPGPATDGSAGPRGGGPAMAASVPALGEDKLVLLLLRQGWQVSTSMVGRILRRLKDRGALVEAVRSQRPRGDHSRHRAYATRKPKAYKARPRLPCASAASPRWRRPAKRRRI